MLGSLLLAACVLLGPEDLATRLDVDGDGVPYPDDCAPEDAEAFPGAQERCDGVDNDCDGNIDNAALDAPTWYADSDGDGYGSNVAQRRCEPPPGHVALAGDCDDMDADAHPGAIEQVGDGVDSDCDGAERCFDDDDDDGYLDTSGDTRVSTDLDCTDGGEGGPRTPTTDCDDSSAAARPGGTEIVGDGIDGDCDGTERCLEDDDNDGYLDASGDTRASSDLDCTDPYEGRSIDPTTDCNDSDANRNPEATEIVDDHLDQDCDGGDRCYDDDDNDGYLDSSGDTRFSADLDCTDPYEGTASDPTTDCDDASASVRPGGSDTVGDGVDGDCNGAEICYDDDDDDGYLDGTGDTRASTDSDCNDAYEGRSSDPFTDCADTDAARHPGATEVCGDGVVNDCGSVADALAACGGLTDMDLSAADAKFIGEDAADSAGWVVASAGDVDGDGYDDVLIGAKGDDDGGSSAGAVYLVLGPVSGTLDLSRADAKFVGEDAFDAAGTAVSPAGDVDGDGYDDILVGAPNDDDGGTDAGAAYLILGPVSGTIDLARADAKFIGEDAFEEAGTSVAAAGDVNGDGFADLLIGAPGDDDGGAAAGAAYVMFGPVSGRVDLSLADAKFIGEDGFDGVGQAVASAGDVNADGYEDILLGVIGDDDGGSDAGAAYLVLGPVSGREDLSLADAKFIGENLGDSAGVSVSSAGDVDADGHDDLLVGAYGADAGGSASGAAYLILGPASGRMDLSLAHAKLVGESAADFAGYAVAGREDVNQDGYDDVLIGAWGSDAGGSFSGAAYLLFGPLAGTIDLSAADAKLTGEDAEDASGWSVSMLGDMDGDGTSDVCIGAYGDDDGGSGAGAAYVVYTGGY